MTTCLDDETIVSLLEDAVAPVDAAVLVAHVDGCARCAARKRALGALIDDVAVAPAFDVAAHVDAVMAAVDAAPQPDVRADDAPARSWKFRALALGGGAIALAAGLLLAVSPITHPEGTLTARGGAASTSVGRLVGVTIRTTPHDVALAGADDGGLVAEVTPDTRYFVTYRNSGDVSVHLLAFAVDARGDVHWLYPAYDAPGSNPSSVVLGATSGRELPMSTMVAFDDVALGPLTFVTILSRAPMSVADVEGLSDRRALALRRSFPDAEVTSFDVRVIAPR